MNLFPLFAASSIVLSFFISYGADAEGTETPPANAERAKSISDAPKPIQELSASIQGKRSEDIRAIIIERLGAPHRDIGSGRRIEQWDTSDGVLTFHPTRGATFSNPQTKAQHWLLRTKNPAAANILQSYEMTTAPDPANHGNRFWLGNVTFGPDSTYRFTDGGQNLDQRASQSANFFMLHSAGTVEVRYVAPITPGTLLESAPEGATVAHLIFTGADKKNKSTFSIICSERERKLVLGAEKPLSFSMDTSWKNFWN